MCIGTWGSAGGHTDAYDNAIQASCEAHGGKYVDVCAEFSMASNRGPAALNTTVDDSDR
ncbi:hypothetical protein [Arthrobacter sp. efr-133-TYG-118]|uniref:hypothetical protein n=1 Tax=Arthrobacter sp. efr-133-TYG-118 TaxID=3040279 RepID=UPI0025504C5E|nr:hypothetical protein [Arthrobacter sp. efr-133-TYG-118]